MNDKVDYLAFAMYLHNNNIRKAKPRTEFNEIGFSVQELWHDCEGYYYEDDLEGLFTSSWIM